jgi:quinol monooxygenase YgiN
MRFSRLAKRRASCAQEVDHLRLATVRSCARVLLVGTVLMPSVSFAQAPANTPVDTVLSAVAYVESRPPAAETAHAALKQYRDASRKQDGFVRIELFEQIGRPGHFAIVEAWRDQNAFDARDGAAQKHLLDALQPIRVSDYDQRLYKTLTTAPEVASKDRKTVYVIAHVDVAPNSQVAVLLKRLSEASRKEPGNLRFDVVQHTMRANHFTVIEHWRNQEALDAHVAAAHTRQYRDELQPMTGSPLDERAYTSVE